MQSILTEQDSAATEMATRLESLTVHYDQMTRALEDEEVGNSLSDEDLLSEIFSPFLDQFGRGCADGI